MGFIYAVLGAAGLFLALIIGMRLFIHFKSSAMKGKDAPSLGGKAGKAIAKGKTALFYFYSPSCGACKTMTPVVKDLASKNETIFPVDISKDMETAQKFGVMATPSMVVVRNRRVADILIGPQSPSSIEKLLNT